MLRLKEMPKPKRYVLYACSWATYCKARPMLKKMDAITISRHPISGKRLRYVGGVLLSLHESAEPGHFYAVEEPPPMAFSRSITVEEHEPLPLIDSMWWRFYR